MNDEMDEIWALYADDGGQALDAAEEALDGIENNPDNSGDFIAPLFRAIHTFKGNARVLGLRNVEALAHICEDLIGLVRDEGVELTEELFSAILLTNDTLRGMLEETAANRQDVDPEPSADLLARLKDLYAKHSGATPAEAEADAEAQTEAPVSETAEEPAPTNEATPSPIGSIGVDLGNLFDELGDSSGFGDDGDDIFDDDAPSEPQEEDAEEDISVSPADTLAEVLVEPRPLPSLSEDAGYRDVFSGMVEDTLASIDAARPSFPDEDAVKKARAAADGLRFGADRLGLADWVDALDKFLGSDDAATAIGALVHDLETLRHVHLDGPAPTAGPEESPERETAEASEETNGTGGLTIDESYKTIFLDMVSDSRKVIDNTASDWDGNAPRALRKEADSLLFAADRMGLADWCEVLQAFIALPVIAPDDAIKLHADLGGLARAFDGQADTPTEETTAEPKTAPSKASFFTLIEPFYNEIARLGGSNAADLDTLAEERAELGEKLAKIARDNAYVRLEDAAQALGLAETADAYTRAELDFYEQLVHIEHTVGYASENADAISPSQLLGIWSSAQIFETLGELRRGLDPNKKTNGKDWFPMFETLMRRVHFAAVHFDVETASQLTMALLDLFSRMRLHNEVPDIILLQMARGYVDTMELVFDALEQGDTPDIQRIEKMFEEATEICFVAQGVVTARSVEQRLNLPAEFHRVLSPESVKSAHDALEENQSFFIIRANLNEDDKMAEGFLEFITSNGITMITNVTVFRDDGTLFDFLISGFVDESTIVERLALIDPSGERLFLTVALEASAAEPFGDAETGGADASDDELADLAPVDSGTSLAMLEAVGAISASQAMIEHEMTKLASEDLMQDILNGLRKSGVTELDPRVRNVLRECLDSHNSRLMALHEAGAQLGNELSSLQQESVENRSRPAEALLRPLKAYVAAQSQKAGAPATLRYTGGSLSIDQMLMEDLRKMLKAMVLNRLAVSKQPTEFHVSLEIEADHIRVVFSDNGSSISNISELGDVVTFAKAAKGELRHANLPGTDGVRLLLRIPQHMIVLDGMVVRVAGVRYVLPIDTIQRILQTDRVVPIAATQNQRMLNMDEEGMIPIRPLSGMEPEENSQLYVIVRSNDTRVAIPVDELVGQQLVLLRPLEGVLSSVRNMSGVAILSGGGIGMVVAVSQMALAA